MEQFESLVAGYAIWSAVFPFCYQDVVVFKRQKKKKRNTRHDEMCWPTLFVLARVRIHVFNFHTRFITFAPLVLGSGEVRNSSVSLLQLPALLRSEWTISFS